MIDRTYVKAKRLGKTLVLTLIKNDDESCGVRAIDEYRDCDPNWQSDDSMHEFFEGFIANTEWEWIDPNEIGALTEAPILGIKDEDGKVIEAYGWMEYQVISLMQALAWGEAVLIAGD